MGAMPTNEQGEGPLRYSEKLSPAVNHYLAESSRQDIRVRLYFMILRFCDFCSTNLKR